MKRRHGTVRKSVRFTDDSGRDPSVAFPTADFPRLVLIPAAECLRARVETFSNRIKHEAGEEIAQEELGRLWAVAEDLRRMVETVQVKLRGYGLKKYRLDIQEIHRSEQKAADEVRRRAELSRAEGG